jgi:hypothetical protein
MKYQEHEFLHIRIQRGVAFVAIDSQYRKDF